MGRRRKILRRLARLVVLFAVLFIIGSLVIAWNFTRPRCSDVGQAPALAGIAAQEVSLTAADGVHTSGWYYARPGVERAAVLLHGHAANRRAMLDRARLLVEQGYNVLAYDARGTGRSDPTPISFGWWERGDLLAAVDWLQSRGNRHIICLGMSQGAATILLAAEGLATRGVDAVVLEAPYATLRQAVDNRFRQNTGLPASVVGAVLIPAAELRLGLSLDDVSPLTGASRIQCPVYLMTGESDVLATPGESAAIYQALPDSADHAWWTIPGAGHIDFYWANPTEYARRLAAFLATVTADWAPAP